MVFRKISHLKMSKVPKNSRFKAAQMVKLAVFRALKMNKIDFTSRKIWVAEKSRNFHTVYSQLGCPGLYLHHRKQDVWFYYCKMLSKGKNNKNSLKCFSFQRLEKEEMNDISSISSWSFVFWNNSFFWRFNHAQHVSSM